MDIAKPSYARKFKELKEFKTQQQMQSSSDLPSAKRPNGIAATTKPTSTTPPATKAK